ncbi:exodeoxyribonuclease III [Roseospira goensis]|uniref:Exodeoxyribonuclease-3 n=1 Tax=Roseospira goensis TaxID=391922 RepID=A0A7W6S364_9PROT|nr:exodeoxyribonuclease III [Roseospira goensis]MBB4287906.1 exodeoxyribonuclease-3 [Roseospira goensis]
MPRVRLVTWNVNSVRKRLPQVLRLLEETAPDVLCLQETKVTDALFPAAALAEMGYPHQARYGMPGYNGVAIVSRRPLAGVRRHDVLGRPDARLILAQVPDLDLDVHCLYVPAGGDVPDPETNPRFADKLAFLDALAEWYAAWFGRIDRIVLCGDVNVAPLPRDVWDHRRLSRVVTHTPVEIDRLARLRSSLLWVDAVRDLTPDDEPVFTWWSYRAGDWRTANKGRRLDHVWVTPPLAPALAGYAVLTEARDWRPPSDHAPLLVTLDLDRAGAE